MKKLHILLLTCIAYLAIVAVGTWLTSCSDMDTQKATNLDAMKCPVIVMAKSNAVQDSINEEPHSIVLIDGNGNSKEFSSKFLFGSAIYDTYKVGDTVKKCK